MTHQKSYAELYTPYSLSNLSSMLPKIKYKIYTTKKESRSADYAVVNYEKEYISIDEPMETRQYRSVILSHPEEELLSFSPPRSISKSQFHTAYPDITSDKLQITEIIEGTLIHLFYDKRIQSWEIATRGAVGGQYHFFDKNTKDKRKTTTVYDMVLDALRLSRSSSLNDYLDGMPKSYSYSFVLQHPENHIILPIRRPCLYLVGVYDIMPVSMCLVSIPQFIYERFLCFIDIPTIQFPRLYTLGDFSVNSFNDLDEKYNSIHIPFSKYKIGLMITHLPSGNRCVIRSPVYEEIYKIRYLNTDLQYQYLCLRYIGRVSDFLSYFSQYKGDFYRFYEQTRDFLENLHASYMSFYVLKTGVPCNLKYWPYIRRLHRDIYLPSLKTGVEKSITRGVVHEFMNKIRPEEWLHILNYEQRKIEMDEL